MDEVLTKIILENALSRVFLYLELVTQSGLADLYEGDNRNVAVNETVFDHAAMSR